MTDETTASGTCDGGGGGGDRAAEEGEDDDDEGLGATDATRRQMSSTSGRFKSASVVVKANMACVAVL